MTKTTLRIVIQCIIYIVDACRTDWLWQTYKFQAQMVRWSSVRKTCCPFEANLSGLRAKEHDTRTRNSCELTRARNLYVVPTYSKIFLARVSRIKYSVFYFVQVSRASFWCEFLVRVSRASVMGLTQMKLHVDIRYHWSRTVWWKKLIPKFNDLRPNLFKVQAFTARRECIMSCGVR